MPYINLAARLRLDHHIADLQRELSPSIMPLLDGELSYCITRLLIAYYTHDGYFDLQRAIGVLECAKLEFYRRAVAPYEDGKARAKGDAYKGVGHDTTK